MEAQLSQLQEYNQASSPPATIKLEDLHQDQMALSAQQSHTASTSVLNMSLDSKQDSPPSSTSKPTKKRKSWGQILPEPKTNLPPRKRAKTADEKEQRRIERVKRNRLAAHNSRERKRQEVDALQEEKQALEERVRAMETELAAYRSLFPQANVPQAAPLAETIPFQGVSVLDEYQHEQLDEFKQEEFKPEPNSVATPSLVSFQSPDSLRSTLDSPMDSAPSTPGTELMNSDSDPTQHSAAMLCDLQYISDDNGIDGSLFDFALFPENGSNLVGGTESFFESSFGEPSTHLSSNPSDLLEPLDASFFDMQPGAGATITVSDAKGLAAECA
ncbi:putative helicase [Venturia nashicola]|uniref:Putative helicase n=1 Tax=Venturia nashicola TaxID=86259 RepID=A0A4Z1PHE3_9PEZI|nr:putative helicase [Venturia nashicola]TLD37219.1 putative helicase [Venturia nashicola]